MKKKSENFQEIVNKNKVIKQIEKNKHIELGDKNNKKEKKTTSSPSTSLNLKLNLKVLSSKKCTDYLTLNRNIISDRSIEDRYPISEAKFLASKLKAAFSPPLRQLQNQPNKKSYKYLVTKKNEKKSDSKLEKKIENKSQKKLEKKISLNVLKRNKNISPLENKKSFILQNNLKTYKNPSKFLTSSLSLTHEKRENNSSSKNLPISHSIRNLIDSTKKSLTPAPFIEETIPLLESKEQLNKKASERKLPMEATINIMVNKPKRSTTSLTKTPFNSIDSPVSLPLSKLEENSNLVPNKRKGSIGSITKSVISQYGIPTVSTSLCDTGVNQFLNTNDNLASSGSDSFSNSEGSFKSVRSLSEARKNKQKEKVSFGNFDSITKTYQDCLNNTLKTIEKQLRGMAVSKRRSVPVRVGG